LVPPDCPSKTEPSRDTCPAGAENVSLDPAAGRAGGWERSRPGAMGGEGGEAEEKGEEVEPVALGVK
jgi:hypothetical protein